MKRIIIKMLVIGAIIGAYKILYAPEEMTKGKKQGAHILWVEGQRGWAESGTNLWTAVTPLPNYNVGIGTSTPAYKLDVVGNSRIQGLLYINSWPISVTTAPTTGYVLKWDGTAFVPQADAGITQPEWYDAGEYLRPYDDASAYTQVYESATPGSGYRVAGAYNTSIYALLGTQYSGVQGNSNNTSGAGVLGIGTGTYGVYGRSDAGNAFGIVGFNTNASGTGIFGVGNNLAGTYLTDGSGVAGTGSSVGIFGTVTAENGVGILGGDAGGPFYVPLEGAGVAGSGDTLGVIGYNTTNLAATYGYLGGLTDGVVGVNTQAVTYNSGVLGLSNQNNTIGVFGQTTGAPSVCVLGTDGPFYWSSAGPVGVSAGSNNSLAGIFYSVNSQTMQAFIENTAYWGFYGRHTSLDDEFWADFDGRVYADGFYTPGLSSNNELVLFTPLMAIDEAYVVFFGKGRIIAGKGNVEFKDQKIKDFLSLTDDYYVFLTPLGHTKGLSVTEKGKYGFRIEEVDGGKGTLEFDYMVVGLKKTDKDINELKEGYSRRMKNTENLLASLKQERIDKTHLLKQKVRELNAQLVQLQKQIKEIQIELKRELKGK